ncbi:MAG: UDP-N-acetylmuramoyl-tripeptide--D-alanyl-D-alanine ligase [Bacteroidetes bacterium]|nr:MAG: UDP-N-acetylmuramoyl-tripeptide--D-alanyl-D-alanine ligase [Bacteroidota bacterium]
MDINKLHNLFLASKGVSTDTRYIKKGQIFFALKGDNFNGNVYASLAIENGASYAVVDDSAVVKSEHFILVGDVLDSLQELATYHRKYIDIPIIAITGTNGKTTTKELINAVMSKKHTVFATQGNLNNHIGVPLTLLSMDKTIQYGIVEMGASHIGEIEKLCSIVNPNYGLITNIGSAHLEGFGSVEGVKIAKNELYRYISETEGILFVNGDDELLMNLSTNISRNIYSENTDSACKAGKLKSDIFLKVEWNKVQLASKLVGDYNFYNILAAICLGVYFKVNEEDIISAIQEYEPENKRSQFLETNNNKLIVDAYNANPTSMRLSVENFKDIAAQNKLLILGDMLELGKSSYDEHEKIVSLVQKLKFDNVFFVGKEFMQFSNKTTYPYLFFNTVSELNVYVKNKSFNNSFILLKASRGISLEKSIPFL